MASEYLDVVYTTGKTARAEIVRRTDNYRYDWDDATFKASGWTTRRQTMTEDTTTLGWYRESVDPAAWDDGEYLLITDDSALATGPIALTGFSVVTGQFARVGAGLARAFWVQDVNTLDQKTLAGVRAATWLGRLLRRFALIANAKFTRPVSGTGSQTLYDDTTLIATITETDNGTTSTIEDPV